MRVIIGITIAMVALPLVTTAQQETWRGLLVEPENNCSHYSRSDYQYPQSREDDIKREIGRTSGGWYGLYEAQVFSDSTPLDIEHIVAAKEAHESGLCERTPEERRAFANDLNNLTLATASLNRQKSSKDAAEWMPPNARCWFARTVVFVKQAHGLSVDSEERDALEWVLQACSRGEVPFMVADAPAIDTRVSDEKWAEYLPMISDKPEDLAAMNGVADHPPVQRFRNCSKLKRAGWRRGVTKNGGTYHPSWDEAEKRTYVLNPGRDRDKDGRACSS